MENSVSATISLAITTTGYLVPERITELVNAASACANPDGRGRIALAETLLTPAYLPVCSSPISFPILCGPAMPC